MEAQQFKVMEWLRRIRDEHGQAVQDASHEEILEETRIMAEAMKERIEKRKKSHDSHIPR